MRQTARSLWLVVLITCAAIACKGSGGTDDARAKGTSDFTSAGPLGGGSATSERFGPGGGLPRESPAYVAPGDIVKLSGSIAYVLNDYRGLEIVDLGNAEPRLVGRVPTGGRGLELLVSGTRLYAVVTESTTMSACATCAGGMQPKQGSHIVVVDVADPRAARLLARVALSGAVAAMRLDDNVLHTVARLSQPADAARPWSTVIVSTDLSDPTAPRERARLELPGPSFVDHARFSDKALYLALYGQHVWSEGTCKEAPAASTSTGATSVVTLEGCGKLMAVDLSTLKVGASVDLRGRIVGGALDHHDGVLRVIVTPATPLKTVNGPSMTGQLLTFRSSAAGELAPAGALELPELQPLGGVPVIHFEGARAYVATANAVDPLLILDLTRPEQPVVAGHVPTAGLVDQIIAVRDGRLLTHGREGPQNMCPPYQLAIHDVADAKSPKLVARETFLSSYDGRARLLEDQGVVVVPFMGMRAGTGAGEIAPPMGVRLLDVNLAGGSVKVRGHMLLGDGAVAGVPIDRILSLGDRVVTVSAQRLDLIDVRDRDAPRGAGALALSRWVQDVRAVAGFAVEVVSEPYLSRTHLMLVPANDPDAPRPLASLTYAGQAAEMLAQDRYIYFFWHAFLPDGRNDPRLDIVEVTNASLRVVSSHSLAGPAFPQLGRDSGGDSPLGHGVRAVGGGAFVVPVNRVRECAPSPTGSMSSPGSRGTRCDMPNLATAPALPPAPPAPRIPDVSATLPTRPGTCPGGDADFVVVDARKAERPQIVARLAVRSDTETLFTVVQDATLFVSQALLNRAEEKRLSRIRYFVTEVNLDDPAKPRTGAAVNVPGGFLAARASDNTWFTVEPTFDERGTPTGLTLFALYRPPGSPKAYLERRLALGGASSLPIVNGRTLFATIDGKLVSIDLAGAEAPTLLARTPVPGATTSGSGPPLLERPPAEGTATPTAPSISANVHRALDGFVFVLLDRLMVVFDAREPAQPKLLEHFVLSPRGGHPVRAAAAGRAFVPRAEWGVAVVDLTATTVSRDAL